jgi:hypothetical protein
MLKQLNDSLDMLPRIPDEQGREISTYAWNEQEIYYEFRIRRFTLPTLSVTHSISIMQLMEVRYPETYERLILEDLCNKMKTHLRSEEDGKKPVS